MSQTAQNDPYAKYGGNLAPPQASADDSDIEQPVASVRTAANSNVGDSFQMNGQDVYVSGVDANGRKTLSPGKPPTPAASDPYAKYGGKTAASSADSGADPYAKYNQPPMTRPQADDYLQTLAAGGTKPVQLPKPASFASTALVDPESPVFGEPIKSAIHPDTRGGRNLVPIQNVAAVRNQMQYEAAHPDEMAQVAHSQAMDTSLPLAERLSNRAGLEARKRTELGQAVSNANDQWKQFAGNKGADAGEAFAQFMARNFQTENPQATPGEIGAARSIGKNVASTAVDPVTHATIVLGGGGKVGQFALSSLFAAGAAKGSYDAAGQLGSIWDRPDVSAQDKAEMASDLVLNTAMAGFAGAHAVRVPFITTGDPLLSKIPQQYRDAVTQKINSSLKATGGVLSRAASTAGDVAAEVANTDRENIPTQGVKTLRRSVPKVPVQSAEAALPLIRAAVNDAGLKTVTASDLLNSAPDKNGNSSIGLIGVAKNEILAQADAAAGPGRTIADLSPQEREPFERMFNALDDVHDHIEQAQADETAELKKAAEKGKIPTTTAAALVRMGMGAGKIAISTTAGPALGRMSRVLLHAYGIPSGFNDLVTGVKGIIGSGGKLSPTLDENLNDALGRTQPAQTGAFGANAETRPAATPFQGDTSVQHETNIAPPRQPHGDARVFPDEEYVPLEPARPQYEPYAGSRRVEHDSLIFPPELPHGNAPMLRDEANPRFQLSSSSTAAQLPQRIAPIARPSVGPDNGIRSFSSVPAGVTPELEPKQVPLTTSVPSRDIAGTVTAARQPVQRGDIFPNDKAMEDWLNDQYERSPRIQRIKNLVKQRIEQGNLPSGIRPSDAELAKTNARISGMIQEANAQGIDTPAQLDRIDQWIEATNKPPKPFQPGQPLKTRPAPTQESLAASLDNPRDVVVPRGQHPESIVQDALMKLGLPALREAARAGDIDYSASDTHQDIIAKIMDAYAGQDEHLSDLAETLQGKRGAVPAGPREKAPADDTDYTDVMARSVEAANARKAATGGTERRQPGNVSFRETLQEMSPAAKDAALEAYHQRERTSAKTGLPNELAFIESAATLGQSHPFIGFGDADDFKLLNDTFDHKYVDEKVLRPIGDLFRGAVAQENGAVHAFHISGDEFTFRASDPAAITRVVNHVNQQMAGAKFEVEKPDGSIVTREGVGLSHGTGSTQAEAEASAYQDKQARRAAGKRTGARDAPQNQSPTTGGISQGEQNPFRNTPERQSVLERNQIAQPTSSTVRPVMLPPDEAPALRASIAAPSSTAARAFVPQPPAPPIEAPRPMIARPTFEREAPPAPQAAAQGGMFGSAPQAPASKPGLTPDNPLIDPSQLSPGEAGYVRTEDLHLAPKELQFKLDTDESGVTNLLKDTRKWNPDMAGVLSVWQNPADGKTYVVNGHHRFELAGRLGQDTLLVRQIKAANFAEARATGALINISEGRGTAIDAAKFLRDSGATPETLKSMGVSLAESKVSDGFAMSRLDPSIFDRVVSREIPEGQAVAIGNATDSPAQQEAILKGIEKAANKGKPLTIGQVESLARRVVSSDVRVEEGQDLFGAFQREHSNFVEEARIDDAIRRMLQREISTFKGVSSETKAKTLGTVEGQSIKAANNAAIAEAARQDLALYDKLSKSRGPVDDIVKSSAKRLASGDAKPADIEKKALEQVRAETAKFRGGQ